jgi:hypothetical protein
VKKFSRQMKIEECLPVVGVEGETGKSRKGGKKHHLSGPNQRPCATQALRRASTFSFVKMGIFIPRLKFKWGNPWKRRAPGTGWVTAECQHRASAVGR